MKVKMSKVNADKTSVRYATIKSSQQCRDLQNRKHDNIKMPNYGIMINKCNAVINTVIGAVTGRQW